MWKCPICEVYCDDFTQLSPQCGYINGVNNFIDWNADDSDG